MPFKKGNKAAKGNPGPRGHPITQVLISQLHEVEKTAVNVNGRVRIMDVTRLHKMVDTLLRLACGGDVVAIKEVINRTEGRVPHSHQMGGGITLTITAKDVKV